LHEKKGKATNEAVREHNMIYMKTLEDRSVTVEIFMDMSVSAMA
jgi:hypothetical protein